MLPTHDLAGAFSRGFETHLFENVPEAGNAEDPDYFVQSIQVGNFGLERHRLALKPHIPVRGWDPE